jgi:hypothetical protein
MRRTVAELTPDPNCINIRVFYTNLDSYNNAKAGFLNTSSLGNFETSRSPNVASLQTMENNVDILRKCAQGEIAQRQDYVSQIYDLQKILESKKDEAKNRITIAKEAKERATFLQNPYDKTSVWEGWFPLGRPLQESSVPVLLTLAILFLVLSLGMFLRLASIEFRLIVPFLEKQVGGYLSKG